MLFFQIALPYAIRSAFEEALSRATEVTRSFTLPLTTPYQIATFASGRAIEAMCSCLACSGVLPPNAVWGRAML